MSFTTETILPWNRVIDLLELHHPLAFNYFYDFHSQEGLKQYDLSPYERLDDILCYGGDHDALCRDITASIVNGQDAPEEYSDIEFKEEGVVVYLD